MLKSLHNVDHANLRLSRTVVRVKGKPCWVVEVRGDWSAEVRYLDNWKSGIVADIRDEEVVDVTPVILGFCQIGEIARYLSRMPVRKTKQGLSPESIFAAGGGLPSFYGDAALSKQLCATIENDYTSYKKALATIAKGGITSLCCHKDWAVYYTGREPKILYKYAGAVGKIVDGKVVLDKKYAYLIETLQANLPEAV